MSDRCWMIWATGGHFAAIGRDQRLIYSCTRSGIAAELRPLRRHLLSLRHLRRRGVLAQLQSANVADNRPAIIRRDLRSVVRHHAEAMRHDVEEVSQGRFAQAVNVK
jgi:hypothetical protein